MGERFGYDVAVVGGAGHVGLPLAAAFSSRGLRVVVFDIDHDAVRRVSSGVPPFHEAGLDGVLAEALGQDRLVASTDPAVLSEAEHVVVVIGTPVDEHLNPDPAGGAPGDRRSARRTCATASSLVLRSTVYPGVTRLVEQLVAQRGTRRRRGVLPRAHRRGQGDDGALRRCPRSCRARPPRAGERAAELFRHLTDAIVELEPEEAELAKLFTNTWRYIKFAAANQFYMMANDFGLDFERIRGRHDAGLPARRRPARRRASPPGRACSRTPCSWPRSTTTTSPSATRRCWSTRASRSTWSPRIERRARPLGA